MPTKHKSNQPLLDELTDAQRAAVIDGADALSNINSFEVIRFDKWMTVARGVAPLCELAARPGMSRKARKHFLKDNGYGSLNESTVSRLLWMAKYETAIRAWRDELTPGKRNSWNSPSSICNRCPAVRKAIAEANQNKPPRRTRKAVTRNVEVAIDVIHEACSQMARDEAAALLARVGTNLEPPTLGQAIDDLIGCLDEDDTAECADVLKQIAEAVGLSITVEADEPEPTPTKKKRGRPSKAVDNGPSTETASKPESSQLAPKAKAEAKPYPQPAPGYKMSAEEALDILRAREQASGGLTLAVPGLGPVLHIPTTSPAQTKPASEPPPKPRKRRTKKVDRIIDLPGYPISFSVKTD
jgi:hypothetical protein